MLQACGPKLLRSQDPPVRHAVSITVNQRVHDDILDAHRLTVIEIEHIRPCYLRTVNDEDMPGTERLNDIAVEKHRGILAKAEAKAFRIGRACLHQSGETAAFKKMRVDDHAIDKAEARCHLQRALAQGIPG